MDRGLIHGKVQGLFSKTAGEGVCFDFGPQISTRRLETNRGGSRRRAGRNSALHGGAPWLPLPSSPANRVLAILCTKSQAAGTGRRRSSPRTHLAPLVGPRGGEKLASRRGKEYGLRRDPDSGRNVG